MCIRLLSSIIPTIFFTVGVPAMPLDDENTNNNYYQSSIPTNQNPQLSLQQNLMPMIKDPSAMNSAFSQSSMASSINDDQFTSITSTNSDAEKQSLKEASEAAVKTYKDSIQPVNSIVADSGFQDFETLNTNSYRLSASASENDQNQENTSSNGEGSRALLVFGLATIIAVGYFYWKLKGIKERERVH